MSRLRSKSSGLSLSLTWEGLELTLSISVTYRYVWYTSGTGVISLPTSNDTVTVKGGANGLILAADIASVSALGHITKYPTKERTVGLVLPLTNNTVPVHTVIHAGACTEADGLDYLNTETD